VQPIAFAVRLEGTVIDYRQMGDDVLEKHFRCACAAKTNNHFCESCWKKWASTMSAMLPGEVAESLLLASRPRWEFLRDQHKAHGGDPLRSFRMAGR